MNKNIIYVLGGIVVVVLVGMYFFNNKSTVVSEMPENGTATTSETVATSSANTVNNGTTVNGNTQTASNIKGYPASWPSDVPKYPNGVVNTNAGNNPKSLPSEAGVVFTTSDTVKTVVSFYLSGLRANGWTIVEDGAGTGNMTSIRATKGKRSFGGFIQKETTGKTEATLGVNIGL